jgi:23S rRNA (guanosine2251-2'-O)-methyltransferase
MPHYHGKRNFSSPKSEEKKDFIFGTRAVIEAIRASKELNTVLIQKGLNNELLKELLDICKSQNIPFQRVPVEKLNRVTRKNHQGVVAFMSAINFASLDNVINNCFSKGKDPLLLILDRVTDVRNFGAIARSAEAAGVDAIIIPTKGAAQVNSDAVKTSAGALHHIPVCREFNLEKTVAYLQQSGIQVVACTEKTNTLLYTIDYKIPTAIIMGSEEDGVSNELLRKADHLGKIPMHGQIDSLNVSVSSALIIYEAVRQRTAL